MSFSAKLPAATDILYVMAVEQEYGPALRTRFSPLFTGVGPVEAAATVAAALAALEAAGKLPSLVVSVGSAGSRRLHQLDVFQASSIAYRDMDASALGFDRIGHFAFFNDRFRDLLWPLALDWLKDQSIRTPSGATLTTQLRTPEL